MGIIKAGILNNYDSYAKESNNKVDNMQKMMGNIRKNPKDSLSENPKKMLEIKNTVAEMKNALMGSSVDWIQTRKESASFQTVNINFEN